MILNCIMHTPRDVLSVVHIHPTQGEIHVLDSSRLGTASCVAKHGYSPITGVDVLTPGTLHCVVRQHGVGRGGGGGGGGEGKNWASSFSAIELSGGGCNSPTSDAELL